MHGGTRDVAAPSAAPMPKHLRTIVGAVAGAVPQPSKRPTGDRTRPLQPQRLAGLRVAGRGRSGLCLSGGDDGLVADQEPPHCRVAGRQADDDTDLHDEPERAFGDRRHEVVEVDHDHADVERHDGDTGREGSSAERQRAPGGGAPATGDSPFVDREYPDRQHGDDENHGPHRWCRRVLG